VHVAAARGHERVVAWLVSELGVPADARVTSSSASSSSKSSSSPRGGWHKGEEEVSDGGCVMGVAHRDLVSWRRSVTVPHDDDRSAEAARGASSTGGGGGSTLAYTPMHLAAARGRVGVARWLARHGGAASRAARATPGGNGLQPVHVAAAHDQVERRCWWWWWRDAAACRDGSVCVCRVRGLAVSHHDSP
jgi:hypothetical protein